MPRVKAFPVSEIAKTARRLGPFEGRYQPDYALTIYEGGNPSRRVNLDLTSAVEITTSKNLNDAAGTFSITLKDGRAMRLVHPMDVVQIRLKGHKQPLATVLRGVVDEVAPTGSSSMQGGEESVAIEGRCLAKYLQVNMLFLPVWEPSSALPTVLTFGAGTGVLGKHASTPQEIMRYLYTHYLVGANKVGLAGTPAARHWVNVNKPAHHGRCEEIRNSKGEAFTVPYVQFDEATVSEAFQQLVLPGFSEGWMDELGSYVYRRPQWDQPVSWILDGGDMSQWEIPVSDVGIATYVEVVPTGALAPPPTAEALLAGRAPVPASYVDSYRSFMPHEAYEADPQFVIATDSKGVVTKVGERNPYYQKMKKYGMRPWQVSSPLLVRHKEAQEQAEGLLRFLLRRQKSAKITLAGEPEIRLGQNILVHGTLRGQRIERAFYIEGVEHRYVEEPEGGHYTTTLDLGHGRDPGDPHFPPIELSDPPAGILRAEQERAEREIGGEGNKNTAFESPPIAGAIAATLTGGKATIPGEAPAAVRRMIAAGNEMIGLPYTFGGGHGGSLAALDAGYDCSGSVSRMLYFGGFLPQGSAKTSGELAQMYQPGAGKWITIYANPDHVYMYVGGLWWDDHGPEGTPMQWYSSRPPEPGEYTERHPAGY